MSRLFFACAPGSISKADCRERLDCYVVDQTTVSVDPAGGRPRVGKVIDLVIDSLVLVNVEESVLVFNDDGTQGRLLSPEELRLLADLECARSEDE